MFGLLALVLAVSGMVFLEGCSEKMPTEGEISDSGLPELDQGGAYPQGYPSYSFYLPMRWICQYDPPGDRYHTKNCGQAVGVMLGGHFNNEVVEPWVITAENNYLADRFNDDRYRNPNGWYTNFNNDNRLGTMLTEFHALHYSVYHGNGPDDVVMEMAHGRPVICGVMIKEGRLVSSGGEAHWVLAVGWDGRIYLHDPGTKSGRYIRYSLAAFERSWATQGKIYAPVWK